MSASNLVEIVLVDSQLVDLAAAINTAVQAAESHAKSAVTRAIEAGDLLVRAKAHVGHGGWESWLLANCTVAPRTARAYMRLSKHMPKLSAEDRQRVAELPLREVVLAIATDPTPPPRSAYHRPIRVADRTAADRASKALRMAADGIRRIAKPIHDIGLAKPGEVEAARAKLVAAIEVIDELIAATDKAGG